MKLQHTILILALGLQACGSSDNGGQAAQATTKFEGEFVTACEDRVITSVINRDVKSVIKYVTFSEDECAKESTVVVYERTLKVGEDLTGGLTAVDITYDAMNFTILFEKPVSYEITYLGVKDWVTGVPSDFSGRTQGDVTFPTKGQTFYQAMRINGDSLSLEVPGWLLPSTGKTSETRDLNLSALTFTRVAK